MAVIKHYEGRIPACGVYCGGCPTFTRDKKPCMGAEYCTRCENCKSYHQCCQSRGITHCFECSSFPCRKFKDFRSRWLKYGQDLIANQEMMREKGIKSFCTHYQDLAKEG